MLAFFFVIVLLIPVTMMGLGLLMYKRPPRKINHICGYRTTWSMKSLKTWEFAHKYCGKLWLLFGIPMTVVSFIVFWFLRNRSTDFIGIAIIIITMVQLVGICLPIIPVEMALRKNFDANGNAKG